MKKLLFVIYFSLFVLCIRGADTLRINSDLYLLKLTEHTFIHVSYHTDSLYGKFTSNGMIVMDEGNAAVFDTPMDDHLSKLLFAYIKDSLKANIQFFIPNHWHGDCTAGMHLLDSSKTTFISSQKTLLISQKKGIPSALISFKENYSFSVGKIKIECAYLGEAHSTDNIVAYVPSEKILFGGCMIKTLKSNNKGNLEDANVKEWPKTIRKVKKKFKKAEIVIPGHGKHGDRKLFDHTIELINRKD